MCGIAGIFDSSLKMPKGQIQFLIEAMVKTIKHRGPDDEGTYCDQGIGLGASRLSILDLSPLGHMPMFDNETGNCIVHNGEAYNYKELKTSLGLSGFKSQTDTEVILKAFGKYGKDCLKYLNGMYSFCIWDPKNRSIFCVRDRMGIKPLFYTVYKNIFYFASEIKSILCCGVPCKPNMKIIYEYLVYGIYDHSEETFFESIKQLPPGYSLTIEQGQVKLDKYWDLSTKSENLEKFNRNDPKEHDLIEEQFISLLMDSIRLRLRSDVPIGINVSGGLDSTLMMAALDRVNNGQGSLKVFSYYYGDSRYDEKAFVEELVNRLNWRVDGFYKVTPNEIPQLFQEAMWYQEQPFPGIISLAKHKLIRDSRRTGVKVFLEGQGGDEIGGGYQYMFGPYLIDLIREGKLKLVMEEINSFGRQNGLNVKQTFVKVVNSIAAYYNLRRSADGTSFVKTRCINPEFLHNYNHKKSIPKLFQSNLLNMQYSDIFYTKLPRILRSCDRASMAYGCELRVPFLDYRLVEFYFNLPVQFKIQKGIQRFLMRKALKSFFSSKLIEIPKRAVVDPQREWLKEPLANWVKDVLFSESFRKRGIFNQQQVSKEFEKYISTEVNFNSFHLWQWLSLELWFRTFIDGNKFPERCFTNTPFI